MHLLSLDEHGELSLRTFEDDKCPPYAILSHTWYADEDEVTYNDVINGRCENKPGREKLIFCGEQAKKDDLKHFWADSCCIDKTSSAELSESLNCMFRWYQNARKCYVYLSDVEMRQGDSHQSTSPSWETTFQKCRWFTRGWTLQELLAPKVVEFWSRDRYMLGSKITLSTLIHERTGIPLPALEGAPISNFSVDERFRWAASRETKRIEDKAYCLLGIFEVYIPPIYGEGEYAFERLQTAIRHKLRRFSKDQSTAHQNVSETLGKHRQAVLDSLRFQELGARQANVRNAHKSTCEWLLEDPDYAKWSHSDRGTFWIVGKPGAGKSTLMKFLHWKANQAKSQYGYIFGFFFNARGNTLERTTNGMYRALLFELCTALPDLQVILDGKQPSSDWTPYSLKSLLTALLQKLGPRTLRLFVDALDECDEQEIHEMVEFMEEIEDMSSTSSGMLSICFASRHYPTITIRNGVRLDLDNKIGHLKDLDKYIEQRLLTKGEGTLIREISREVREKANGVFLWAALVVDILNKDIRGGRMSRVKKRLDETPSGLSALFQDTLRRDNDEMEEFSLCIQWILFARRPLELEEFYFAVQSGLHEQHSSGVSRRAEPWDREQLTTDQMERFVRTASKGLAETVGYSPESAFVQFIHESVRDFFGEEGQKANLFPVSGDQVLSWSHERLKDCCLNYLAPLSLDAGFVLFDHRYNYPFVCYASDNVLYHANEAADRISQNRLFEVYPQKHHIELANAISEDRNEARKFGSRMLHPETTLLYLAAEDDLPRLIVAAKKNGYKVWQRFPEGTWRFAVVAAFVHGSRDALEVLLDGLDISSLNSIVEDPGFNSHCHLYAHNYQDRYIYPKWIDPDLDRGLVVCAAEYGNWGLAGALARMNADCGILFGARCSMAEDRISFTGAPEIDRLQLLDHLIDKVPWFNAGVALIAAAMQNQAEIIQRILDHSRVFSRTDISAWRGSLDDGSGLAQPGLAVADKEVRMYLELRPAGGDSMSAWEDLVLYALQRAIMLSKSVAVGIFLHNGVDVNAARGLDCYPLQLAAFAGDLTIVRRLIAHGADVKAQGPRFGSALQAAAAGGRNDIVHVLLDNGADVNASDGTHKTALHWAAEYSREEIMCSLLDRGAEINASVDGHDTALHSAAKSGHKEIVRLLLDRGADINAVSGEPPATGLQAAFTRGDKTTMRLLLDRGAGMNADGEAYETALLAASVTRHRVAMKRLLQNGADADARSMKNGQLACALLAAAVSGSGTIVSMLLEYHPDGSAWNTHNRELERALSAAAAAGREDIVALLLEHGADVNARSAPNGNFRCALSAAAAGGHSNIVSTLLEHGADIDAQSAQNPDRESAFYALVAAGDDFELSEMRRGRADIDDRSVSFATALYSACCSPERNEAVALLVHRGADVNVNCGERGYALSAAAASGNKDTVTSLIDRGADINACDNSAGNVLYNACLDGNSEIVEFLIDRGADMNATCGPRTAIQAACKNARNGEKIFRVLLRRNAALDHGMCLFHASQQGNVRIVKYLLKHGASISNHWLSEALEVSFTARTELENRPPFWLVGEHHRIEQLLLNSGAKYRAEAGPNL